MTADQELIKKVDLLGAKKSDAQKTAKICQKPPKTAIFKNVEYLFKSRNVFGRLLKLKTRDKR